MSLSRLIIFAYRNSHHSLELAFKTAPQPLLVLLYFSARSVLNFQCFVCKWLFKGMIQPELQEVTNHQVRHCSVHGHVPSLPCCNLIGHNLRCLHCFLGCDVPPEAVSPWYPSAPLISSSNMSGWSRKQELSVLIDFSLFHLGVHSYSLKP